MSEKDFTGKYDETELVELSQGDEHGGTTPVVTATIAASVALCPTTTCTGDC